MTTWRPQPFRTAAKSLGRDQALIQNALGIAHGLSKLTPGAEPIFTLRHLAHLIGTPYPLLRSFVTRDGPDPYRVFKMHKRALPGQPRRFRTIVLPDRTLMRVQRWINANVLEYAEPHRASSAYSRGDSVKKAAELHCGARWLIKMDLRNFFESITERQVYRAFRAVGYQPLVSFELARICTRVAPSHARLSRYQVRVGWPQISEYSRPLMGHLPQGAPTSPRLSNLAAIQMDHDLSKLAQDTGFTYSRYADDLTFSTSGNFSRSSASALIGGISSAISKAGFTPNEAKTNVSPPGARKVVLGLLVDRDDPRLPREFKSRLRQHLHYLKIRGAAAHAASQGDATVFGVRRHVLGLIQHARQIEPAYGDTQLDKFNKLVW